MRVIGSSPHLGAGPALSAVCPWGPLAREAQVRLTLFSFYEISIDINNLRIDILPFNINMLVSNWWAG
jgi:hypothetical protein